MVTPGAILLGLLKNEGMPDVTIGAWRGAMAVSGALGTFLAPWLLKRQGILASAKITIIGMQSAIASAALLYMLRGSSSLGLQLFLAPVTMSRMFLYAYDLVEVQVKSAGHPAQMPHLTCALILQLHSLNVLFAQFGRFETLQVSGINCSAHCLPMFAAQGMQLVDGSVRGVVSSTETSFTNIATLMAYGITAGVHDPSQFHILVIIGLAGVSSKRLTAQRSWPACK